MFTRRKQKCLLVAIFLILCFILFLLYDSFPPRGKARFSVGPPRGHSPFITIFPRGNQNMAAGIRKDTQKVKTILLWTEFFGSKDWLTDSTTFKSCAVKTCRVTQKTEELEQADAVLMNVRNIYSPDDLPPLHPPHQVWIIHGSEPPYYIEIDLREFNNVFNWTSWYRTDADVFSPYGSFTPVSPTTGDKADHNNQMFQESIPTIFQPNFLDADYKLEPELPETSHSGDRAKDPFGLHDLMVFWAASSCINYSQRYKLVSALQKYLPVDTYGFCGTKTCEKSDPECEKLLRRYKFVLAFENGYCRDYVTEKYWQALVRNQIPIVGGGADYAKITIPGSYIDADNFSTVQELAKFIQRVGSDRDLYNSFFTWKSRYRRLSHGFCNWCQMCARLHDETRPPQVYSNFRGWVGEDTCPLQSTLQQDYVLRSVSQLSVGPREYRYLQCSSATIYSSLTLSFTQRRFPALTST